LFVSGDDEGWTTTHSDGSGDATDDFAVRGNKRGNFFLWAKDKQNNRTWGWRAPAKFHGDHADTFGRYLKYSLWVSDANAGNPASEWYVGIRGGGVLLAVSGATLARPRPGTWNQYAIRLDASGGWQKLERRAGSPTVGKPATDAEIRKVLADVQGLWIQGEFSHAHDEGRLDDVEFGAER
jgi:hypothetical protein